MMKPSTRIATLFIFLFFLFLNSLLVYLIIERISEAKNKFGFACTDALVFSLNEYTKMKGIDSASLPTNALIAYAPKKIEVKRLDTQTVTLNTPFTSIKTDTIGRVFIEMILNSQTFRSVDLALFDSLFQKSLRSRKVHSQYRLDTFTMQARRAERGMIMGILEQKKKPEYSHITRPVRFPFNSNVSLFAQVKNDPAFTRNDLLWPLVAFASILLIGNAALVFVYRTIRKQKKINELKTDFINNITHEMKTPITIASAGLDALEHHVTPTERTNFYLLTSKRQLHLLNDFVERILDAAVQDVSDFILQKEKIDLHALFNELVQSHSVLKGKPVSFQVTGEGPAIIQGDRLHLQTAFHNIIDNAIKYSGETVNIHIDIEENKWECTVKILDNGRGIPPQYLKNIFEKFFRVPQGDAQSVKGFGLGLYYVKSIVEKHSGDITVHSKKGSGTEFIITIPKHI